MIRPLLASLMFLLPAPAAMAQGWALDGMDPVAYGSENAALPGRSDLVTVWQGEAWHFTSEQNRALFEANPRAYVPGLGGLCALALSEGRPEPGNPRYFVVIGDRTYLLRSERARQRLLADPQQVLARALAAWARLNP